MAEKRSDRGLYVNGQMFPDLDESAFAETLNNILSGENPQPATPVASPTAKNTILVKTPGGQMVPVYTNLNPELLSLENVPIDLQAAARVAQFGATPLLEDFIQLPMPEKSKMIKHLKQKHKEVADLRKRAMTGDKTAASRLRGIEERYSARAKDAGSYGSEFAGKLEGMAVDSAAETADRVGKRASRTVANAVPYLSSTMLMPVAPGIFALDLTEAALEMSGSSYASQASAGIDAVGLAAATLGLLRGRVDKAGKLPAGLKSISQRVGKLLGGKSINATSADELASLIENAAKSGGKQARTVRLLSDEVGKLAGAAPEAAAGGSTLGKWGKRALFAGGGTLLTGAGFTVGGEMAGRYMHPEMYAAQDQVASPTAAQPGTEPPPDILPFWQKMDEYASRAEAATKEAAKNEGDLARINALMSTVGEPDPELVNNLSTRFFSHYVSALHGYQRMEQALRAREDESPQDFLRMMDEFGGPTGKGPFPPGVSVPRPHDVLHAVARLGGIDWAPPRFATKPGDGTAFQEEEGGVMPGANPPVQ